MDDWFSIVTGHPNAALQLSVVIPTMGRPQLIPLLESLIETDRFSSMEILVCGPVHDAELRSRLDLLVGKHSNISYPEAARRCIGRRHKRNEGWRLSRAPIVAFLDDDVRAHRRWPELILVPFEDPKVALVSGPGVPPEDVSPMGRLAGLALASQAAGAASVRYRIEDGLPYPTRWSGVIGCNMAIRREVLEGINGFSPDFEAGDDLYTSFQTARRGHKVYFSPRAGVDHYPRASLSGFIRQIYGYGAARIQLMRAGADIEWSSLLPAALVLMLAILGIATLWGSAALAVPVLLVIGIYILFNGLATIQTVIKTGRWQDLMMFFVLFIMHATYGCAQWIELLRPPGELMTEEARRPAPRSNNLSPKRAPP